MGTLRSASILATCAEVAIGGTDAFNLHLFVFSSVYNISCEQYSLFHEIKMERILVLSSGRTRKIIVEGSSASATRT
jgi:hypothetical protein